MVYFYSVMWILVGLILIIRMGRESRAFYPIGGFFLLLGCWWFANGKTGVNLFTGTWGLILRVITALVLVFACAIFFKEIKKSRKDYDEKNKGG